MYCACVNMCIKIMQVVQKISSACIRANMQCFNILPVFFVASLLLQSCSAGDGKTLSVKIIPEYSPPSTFTFEPPSYRAASALTLSCLVDGVEDSSGLFYEWSSTCSGNCFTRGVVTGNVSTPYLHSYDTGVHTCMVYDVLGCTGNDSITVDVVGAGIYMQTGRRVFANNSLVAQGTVPSFRCLSGSSISNVGDLIGPDGSDVILSTTDPFFVSRGSSYDPGTLFVRSLRALKPEDTGIYTYRTPDENGDIVDFYFGIYIPSNTSAPYCPAIEYTLTDGVHTLSCASYNTPPTQVIWERDGRRIHCNDTTYTSNQLLLNRTTSAYNNTLSINATIEDVIGRYSCTVVNSAGSSEKLTKAVKALVISGHDTPVLVNTSRSINCSTHLEVTRMEWVVVAVGNAVEVDEDGGQSLVLPLSPTTTGLDGAEFTCKITTARGKTFSETITVKVKELAHKVEITGPANPLSAGEKYSLTCTVTSDLPPSVKWLGPGNHAVDGSDVSVRMLEPVTQGNTTTLVLYFDPIKTSHGGTYTCTSISNLKLKKQSSTHVKVQITADSISVSQSLSSVEVYTGDPLDLVCLTRLNQAVDSAVRVTHQWTGPGGVVSSSSGISVSAVTGSDQGYSSRVTIASLSSSHSGTYTCSSTVYAQPSSVFIQYSTTQTSSTSFNAAIRVTIEITYISPDDYPHYSPPNYRTASSVSLKCVASGTTGSVTYLWSSTCRSDCFAYSSSAQIVSELFLRSRDAGVHTCRVADGLGNSGMNNITMNIVGAGIYVEYGASSSIKTTEGVQGPQPANGYAIIDRDRGSYYYYSSVVRLDLYCCSNTTSLSGTFTIPYYGYVRSSTYREAYMYQNGGSDDYAGCIRLYFQYRSGSSYTLSSSYTGIYTCTIPDSQGSNLNVNIGIYNEDFSTPPSLYRMEYRRPRNGSINLVCKTRNSPPSIINWYRDGTLLEIDGGSTDLSVTLTSRASSYFDVSLTICNSPDDVVGNYRCEIGNRFGNSSKSYEIQGLQMVCSGGGAFVVGQVVQCSCTSDIAAHSVQWYREDAAADGSGSGESALTSNNRLNSLSIPVTTDGQGDVYTCIQSSACGNQEETITVNATVPANWASVSVGNSAGQNALNNTDYVLTCILAAIYGMTLVPSMEWVGPDGAVVTSEGSITVGEVKTQGTLSTLALSFSPVLTSDRGRYLCRAVVSVPWMATQPPQLSASANMAVTTQALFQLKLHPLPHCSTWGAHKAHDLEWYIKKEVEKAVKERCDCDFSSTAISSGEFSCQFTSCKSNECDLATHVTYRAILSGSTDSLSANELMTHLQDWRETRGTLLYNVFRLRLASAAECSVSIDSFDEEECK